MNIGKMGECAAHRKPSVEAAVKDEFLTESCKKDWFVVFYVMISVTVNGNYRRPYSR